MSTTILLSSEQRDRTIWTSPAEFTVNVDQTAGWNNLSRIVSCVKPCSKKDACNLLFCVKLLYLTLPSAARNANNATLPENEPYILVRFTSTEYRDNGLINTINSFNNDATFVCVLERAQGTGSEWLQYKCLQTQCIRFNAYKPEVYFRIFTREGPPMIPFPAGITTNTIRITDAALPNTPTAANQVSALFEFTPYVREGDYDNHVVDIWQMT